MPSKKKAKGKGRGATKSRKELRNDCAGSVKNDVESQMQGLKVNNSKQDNEDEDALLEAAINLAAAEREDLDATDAEKCDHGFVPLLTCMALFHRGRWKKVGVRSSQIHL